MKYINHITFCFVLFVCSIFRLQAQNTNDNTIFIPDSTFVAGPLVNIPKEVATISYSDISGEKLLKMSSSNFTNSLFGLLPGLTTLQSSGEPSTGNSYLTIRGLGSYNYPQATIFIDGYQSDLVYLSPSEIESITLLKDAAALAPFGMKGAHGVIWITTKRGIESKPIIGVEFQTGLQKPTILSKPLSATEYAQLYNEAYSNDLGTWSNYYNIPSDIRFNTDWYDKVLKKSALLDRQDITIRGGSSSAKYFVLLGHVRNSGLYKVRTDDSHSNAKFEQFIVKANLDFSMLKFFEGRVNISGRIEDRSNPNYSTANLWKNLESYPNIIYNAQNTDGSYSGTSIHPDNPYASIQALGFKTMHDRTFSANFDLKEKLDFITPGLYINQGISLSTWTRGTRSVSRNYTRLLNGIAQTTDRDTNYKVQDDYGTNQWNRLQIQLGVGYSQNFGNSTLKTAVNYLQYLYHIDANLNGKAGLNNNYAFQNIGGRIHYDYKSKYFAELGFALSGSDNYAKGNRFGFYHALSFGWNIFNNKYVATNPNINLLKINASVGTTGNDHYNDGRYLYQKYYSSVGGGGFATGNDTPTWHNTMGLRYVPNPDIFAEKSFKYNIGIDSKFFNKWSISVDAFLSKNIDIVSPDYSLSAIFGATPPYKNIGKVTNKGFEFVTNYTSSIGKLQYTIGVNASYAINKIDYMAEYDALSERSAKTGKSIGTRFGYDAIGFYDVSDFDTNGHLVSSLPKPSFGSIMPGDVKYRDINNDGFINEHDKIEIGKGFLPTLTYAGSINLAYQGFDLGVLIQGIQGRDINLLEEARLKTIAFENNGNVYPIAKNRWAYYPNQGIDTRYSAQYPRLSLLSNNNNYQTSTLWIKKADYVRIRYIEVGYSIPQQMIENAGLSQARIYLNATNPFTISSLMSDYDLDPEVLSGYPALKSITMGISLKF